jgi:hypothetical protein
MKVKGVAFTQKLMRFDDHPGRVDFHTFSDTGTVPCAASRRWCAFQRPSPSWSTWRTFTRTRGFWPADRHRAKGEGAGDFG